MARKQDKLRPYRVDYFNIDEMKDNDLALVRSVVERAVTAATAATQVLTDNAALPIVLIRSYRYYKQITPRKDVYKAVEDLFSEKNALIVMGEVEKYRAEQTPVVADHATPDPAFGVDKATFYKTNAGTQVQSQAPPAAPADELGHVTRFSDSSLYDEVCTKCGATDTSGKLEDPCPGAHAPTWSGGLQVPVSVPTSECHCSFAFPMSSDAMVLHMQSVHGVVPTSGPDSPATVAAVADLNGMLAHDEHEQAMDTFVPEAGAVEDYNRVFPAPEKVPTAWTASGYAVNDPMPGTPSINPFVVTGDEPLSLQLKVLAFSIIAIVVLGGLIYFLRP
jgi:hypothetical protein